MFWDLRVRGLEAQALEPLKALDEMRGGAYPEDRAVPAVVSRLNAIPEYRRLFAARIRRNDARERSNLGRALAAFQRTLVASNTPFDRYMRGETTALSPTRFVAWSSFSRWDASTAIAGRCFRTSPLTCLACRTTRS